MKSSIYIFMFLLTILTYGVSSWASQGQNTSRSNWEYKVTFDANANNEKQLNELGAQGWELVEIRTTLYDGHTTGGHYYFKRAK